MITLIKIILILVISIVIVGSWIFVVVPELKAIPYDFNLILQENSHSNRAMEIGGPLIDVFDSTLLTAITSKDFGNDALELTVSIGPSDPNESGYSSEETFLVNKFTKKILNDNSFFMFPINVKKKNYLVTHPSVSDTNIFVFQKTEKVFDLETYLFSCENFGTDITGNNPRFPDTPLFYDGTCSVWVEPITGNQIKFEQSWNTYTIDDGIRTDITNGNKQNSVYSTSVLVQSTINQIELYYFYDYIIPFMLGVISLGVLVLFFSYLNLQEKNKKIQIISDKLIQAERLSSIGELSARLAHDLRNPLSIIHGSLHLLKSKYGTDDSKLEYFDKIDRAIDRIIHQIDDVLNFVKSNPPKLHSIKFSKIVKNSIDALEFSDKIELIIPKNDVSFLADEQMLTTAMNNLILNGIQAITGTGTVEITVNENKDTVIIQVNDSGDGIPKANIKKIFDPLFTTKQSGTGLGLSSVKSIIESHGGKISVTSPPTIFTIILPKINS